MDVNHPLYIAPYTHAYSPVPNYNGKFFGIDSEDNYRENLKKVNADWKYIDKEITYKFNSLSYRAEELDFYKDKDFILVLGCSHTHGTGLAEDEIWHHTVKKGLGVEVLNAGFSGTGPDIQMLNSLLFLKNSNLRPKMVIIQWPEINRFSLKGNDRNITLIPMFVDETTTDSNTQQLVKMFSETPLCTFYKTWLDNNNSENHGLIFMETTRLLWKLAGIPLYEFTFENIEGVDSCAHLVPLFHGNDMDKARDLLHYGQKLHEAVGTEILKKIL